MLDVTDAVRVQPCGQRGAGGGEAGEEVGAKGAAVADDLGARFGIMESIAPVEGEVR